MENKTRITFKMITDTQVDILLDGHRVGDIWSYDGDKLPAPSFDYCTNMVQLCGFKSKLFTGDCDRFYGSDLVAAFELGTKLDKDDNKIVKEVIEEVYHHLIWDSMLEDSRLVQALKLAIDKSKCGGTR